VYCKCVYSFVCIFGSRAASLAAHAAVQLAHSCYCALAALRPACGTSKKSDTIISCGTSRYILSTPARQQRCSLSTLLVLQLAIRALVPLLLSY